MVVSFHVKTTVLRDLFSTSGVAGVCRLNSHAGPHGYTRSDSHIWPQDGGVAELGSQDLGRRPRRWPESGGGVGT